MKDNINNMNPTENKTDIANSSSDISLHNSTDNTAPVPDSSNKYKKISRFPIAETNIIGFK